MKLLLSGSYAADFGLFLKFCGDITFRLMSPELNTGFLFFIFNNYPLSFIVLTSGEKE